MFSTSRAVLAVSSLVALVVVVSGCGVDVDRQDDEAVRSTVDVPDFSGPYAAEFAETYRGAESEFVREALSDEEISDAEYAEMTERFRKCLEGVGITFNGFDETGAYTTTYAPNRDDTRDLVDQCVRESGQDAIGLLRDIMSVNPENRDMAEVMAECLVREGAVAPGYGAEDYVADTQSRFADRELLSDELETALTSCSTDPLGTR